MRIPLPLSFAVIGLSLGYGCIEIRKRPADNVAIVQPAIPRGSAAEKLFDQGLAELAETADSKSLETLLRDHPNDPWADRAVSVMVLLEMERGAARRRLADSEDLAHSLRLETERLEGELIRLENLAKDLREERNRVAADNAGLAAEKAGLVAEAERLRGQIASLEADLAQLKELTIEMELRR